MNDQGVLVILSLLLRVAAPIYCAMKAENLNRKPGLWAISGFFFPIISMIWISTLPKKTVWTKE